MPIIKQCECCGKEFTTKPYKKETAKYCSRECMNNARKGQHKGEWITKICPSCGQEFLSLKSRNKKYCSSKCNQARLEKQPPICNCDYCGQSFIPLSETWLKYKNGDQKTLSCSRGCSNELKKTGKFIICDNCGEAIYRTIYRLNKNAHQFCSLKCQKEFEHKETYEMRKCEICGKAFECFKISTQRFCSIQCQGKWQSTQTGILNPRSKRTLVKCDYCNKEIYVPNYKLDVNNHFFCNESCRQKWYAEIWSQRPEWKVQSRERAIKLLESGIISNVNTKPQMIINQLLNELQIEYQNEYNVKYYAIDNYLSASQLMIEVMGDYWHSNPTKFAVDNLNQMQINRIYRDKAKHTYIKNKYRIEILYLWENDILSNLELCRLLILKYMNQKGLMTNYHSFNYKLDEQNNLTISPQIIIPYQNQQIKQIA